MFSSDCGRRASKCRPKKHVCRRAMSTFLSTVAQKHVFKLFISSREVDFPCSYYSKNMFSSDLCRRAKSTILAITAQRACFRAIVVDVRCRYSSQLSLNKMCSRDCHQRLKSTFLATAVQQTCFRAMFVDVRSRISFVAVVKSEVPVRNRLSLQLSLQKQVFERV